MLPWLLDRLAGPAAASLEALSKITARAALAALVSFLLALLLGPRLIDWLSRRYSEPVERNPEAIRALHRHKQATPTMGGLFIVAGLLLGILAFAELGNVYVQLAVLLLAGLSVVGVLDDLTKLARRRNGISARAKLAGQTLVAAAASVLLYLYHGRHPEALGLALPLSGEPLLVGPWFVPLSVLVLVGSSNAVNLADGLDGLAGGCLIFATSAVAVLAYIAGHVDLAAYLGVPHVPGAGELVVVAAAMIGAVLGFLWFNCFPAQVFMGDTGSLPLGGLLGWVAVVTRQELLLVVIGGVFVAEAASVLLQVGLYKLRRRRLFLCAPLHHHFQFKGWPENKIVVRFWIAAAALCALLGLGTLKLDIHDSHPGGTGGLPARVDHTPSSM